MTSHYEGILPVMVFLHQQTSVFAHVHTCACTYVCKHNAKEHQSFRVSNNPF